MTYLRIIHICHILTDPCTWFLFEVFEKNQVEVFVEIYRKSSYNSVSFILLSKWWASYKSICMSKVWNLSKNEWETHLNFAELILKSVVNSCAIWFSKGFYEIKIVIINMFYFQNGTNTIKLLTLLRSPPINPVLKILMNMDMVNTFQLSKKTDASASLKNNVTCIFW